LKSRLEKDAEQESFVAISQKPLIEKNRPKEDISAIALHRRNLWRVWLID